MSDITFQDCLLKAVAESVASTDVYAVAFQHDIAGTVRLINCDLAAINTSTDGSVDAQAHGIAGRVGTVEMIGGSITSSSAAAKETEVWDLDEGNMDIRITNVSFSKWKGDIAPASAPLSTVQRTINIAVSSATAILSATALTGSEQASPRATTPMCTGYSR